MSSNNQRSEEIAGILRQALEALEDLGMKHYENTGVVLYKDVFTDLRQAIDAASQLPEAEKQEPLGEEFSRILHENLWDLYER